MALPDSAPTPAKAPLAVDLDGTLIRCDLFFESILKFVFAQPWKAVMLIAWLTRGRAYAKARLAERYPPDVAHLPYDDRVLDWLRGEREAGRALALATASDRRSANAVAEHLGLFERVFASDGRVNLKAFRKRTALLEAYPEGFAYAGNERADVVVWRSAKSVVVANAPPGLQRRASAEFEVERSFARVSGGKRAFVRAMRPPHWAKNLLVFVPMLAGQGWLDPLAWAQAGLAFVALSLAASGIYIFNDCADIEADRRHPSKRTRPIASGELAPAWALVGAVVLLGAGLMVANIANVLALAALYLAINAIYSLWLKRVMLADVFVLAGLHTLRVVIGGAATGFVASEWLLAFSGFFFLSLALVKRVAEMETLEGRGGGALAGRDYESGDAGLLKAMGVGAGLVSALVLALYLQDPANLARYEAPAFLWALPVAVVFWLCRAWLIAHRGEMHDDPLLFAFGDRATWIVGALVAAAFTAAAIGV